MYWIGRSIVLLALVIIAAAILWPDAWRSTPDGPAENQVAVDPSMPLTLPNGNLDGQTASDDNPHISDMQNPLTRAIDGMLASHGEVFKDSESGLRDQLQDADRQLTNVKADIRSAMQNANRQIRIPGQKSPLVMLVVFEGIAKSELGFYGQIGKTPLLESFAEKGTVFDNCYAGPSSEIAQFMFLTGSGHSKKKSRYNRLAQMMWNSGYRTILMDGTGWMSSAERQFIDEDVQLTFNSHSSLPTNLTFNGASAKIVANENETLEDDVSAAELLVGQARELIENNPSHRPTFVEFHFSVNGEDDKSRAEEVAQIDQAIGRLVYSVQKSRNSRSVLLMVTGLPGDTGNDVEVAALSETELQVPLMVYRSHGESPARVIDACGLLDVLPTLADGIGSSRIPRNSGTSLLKWMNGEPAPTRVFRWTNPNDEDQVAVRQGPWKAIFGSSNQLFFLPDDPQEKVNVAGKHQDVLSDLAKYGRVEQR